MKKNTALPRQATALVPVRRKRKPIERKVDTSSKQPRFTATEPTAFYYSTLQWMKTIYESEPEYKPNSRTRDEWLSHIWHLEPHLAGVLGSVISIDTNRGWSLEGGRNQVMRYSDILHSWQAAPGIFGWRPGIASASLSYYTTDIGGIVELGRDGEKGPIRDLYHVDPTRCVMNGSNERPLTYIPINYGQDTHAKEQDWAISDYMRMSSMLSISETMNGLGYCAVSRCLELAKVMIAIYEHDREKLGAKAPKGLLLLSGISEAQWDDAMEARKEKLKGMEYDYFNAVAVLASTGAESLSADLIALSQLPENFNLQEFTSLLMYGYALCFGYDPSEFYPVQFGSLGRGTEMEVQHEKATGKGGLNFVFALQEQLQRPDVLPASLKYEFDQRDEQGEIEQAQVQEAWNSVFKSVREAGLQFDGLGGVSRTEYRMLLADKSIIPKEWTEVEEEVEATDEEIISTGEGKPEEGAPIAAPAGLPIIAAKDIDFTKLKAVQRRRLRDNLLSKRHIWRAIERFPQEDIVQYKWPENAIATLWEKSESLLDPMLYPSAPIERTNPLYKSKDVTIYPEDVELAMQEAQEINPQLYELLNTQPAKKD